MCLWVQKQIHVVVFYSIFCMSYNFAFLDYCNYLILHDTLTRLWFRKNICYLIKDMFHYLLLTCLTSVVKYRIAIKCVTLASQIGCTFFRRKCRGKLVLKLWISYLSYRIIYAIIICIYKKTCLYAFVELFFLPGDLLSQTNQ